MFDINVLGIFLAFIWLLLVIFGFYLFIKTIKDYLKGNSIKANLFPLLATLIMIAALRIVFHLYPEMLTFDMDTKAVQQSLDVSSKTSLNEQGFHH